MGETMNGECRGRTLVMGETMNGETWRQEIVTKAGKN